MRILDAFRSSWQRSRRWFTRRIFIPKWFDTGLRGKMSALVTIGMVGLVTIFSVLVIATTRQMTQQLLKEHVLQSRILAENLDSSLSHVAGMLTVLSPQVNMTEPQSSLDEWGSIFLQDFHPVRGLYILDANRQLLAATETAPAINWEAVQLPALTGTEAAGRIISTQGLARPLALVAVPISPPAVDQPPGFIAAVLDLSDPDIFMPGSPLDLEHQGTLQVLDSRGTVLVSSHPDRTLTAATIARITNQFTASDQPTFEACLGCEMNETDTGTIIAYASLSQVPWAVLVWHDTQELFAPVRRIGFQTLAFGLVGILGAVLLVFVTTRSVIEPVRMLTAAIHKIGEAQPDLNMLTKLDCAFSTTLVNEANHRRDEIGVLAKSFIAMCTRLEQSIEEIQSWNRELDTRVQARTQQLSILNAVAMTVNQSLNLEEILNRALDQVIQLTDVDVIAVYIQNAIRGQLELRAFRGLAADTAQQAFQVGLLDSDCGGVMELGRTVIVPDISMYRGRGARLLQRENITSLMHVPLMTKGWALGSMCVGTHHIAQFTEDEQELMNAIGNQIAIAVENARLYADLQRKDRVRGELFKRTLAVQEEERKRIARELHDEISQSLTALLYEAEDGLELNHLSSIKKRLQSICDLSKHTLDDVHKLIFDLRPSMLDQLGLVPALRWLSETRLETKGMRVNVVAHPDPALLSSGDRSYALPPEIETALYRVVQEAINNIARHAAARNVEIELFLKNGLTSVKITDDGIGFDPGELNSGGVSEVDQQGLPLSVNTRGLGLLGMQERIQLLGGEMEITSAPGSGTQIYIQVPIQTGSPAYD